ncbi:type VI secretion system contractile sheath large subunit [Pseudoalteromonas sp. McH1-7]|uniref:type VI secretion system contractile sheath large subunit n=1 Tax=Pseudoalteromonas TaxID=53246 RepID=UPI000F64D6A9|nr:MULTISPECIES: type VI secretion system contractile sheath large subunit [Pseudoalteromonas]MDW7551247.1 type VI secretion system contractile sheath large subunit [Pseudoalteromonas peptidolytica]NUZ12290.1 type VI secretion system contractile sheath large subunit [Pseudoalteromonas sp. McH1-7]RRS10383.1 type VI secretion system contractile sheath large subunit [Pseudoalteromonas sp. J010]
MSEELQQDGGAAAGDSGSFLDRAISATSQTAPDRTKELLTSLTKEAMSGTVTWDKNLTDTIANAVAEIDKKMSQQLSAIMQQDSFQELEGSWLGLQKLIRNSALGTSQKVKLLNITKDELLEQFEDAPAVDRSPLFNTLYQHEYGTAGGEPYGLILGDYAFSQNDEDVALLRYMGEVAAASHAPFIAAAAPEMFELSSFSTFSEGKPIAPAFDSPSYASWNSFRESDDARYVALTMPRTMARLPYGGKGKKIKSFEFEELATDNAGNPKPTSNDEVVWSNAAYEMALKMNQAFEAYGWCTAIRGMENGGKVEALPNLTYLTDSGDITQQCPTEVNLTDEREKELSDLGFLPLVHYKNTDYAVFLGGQTTQKPKEYTDPDATANAAISARLPYIMASSRIAHYLKVMGRDNIGSNMEAADIQKQMSEWIAMYTNSGAMGNEERAKTPLAEAQISVIEQPGRPGAYSAVAHLRPWLQMEELTTSVRMVASLPG